jgi:hypothetical protein
MSRRNVGPSLAQKIAETRPTNSMVAHFGL